MSAVRSNLHPLSWTSDALWLAIWIVPSVLGHLLILGGLALISALPSCQSSPLLIEDAIEVSLVSLPQSNDKMAQMDVRAATAPAPVAPDAPAPEDAPGLADDGAAEPEPVTQSEMVVQKPDANESRGDPDREHRESERRDALRRLALSNLDAPVGANDSSASDPDSTSSERIDLGGSGTITDPELARYSQRVRELFMSRFNPLPTLAEQNPDIGCQIMVRFDLDTGQVTSWSWVSRSGNPSWDGAAERAVEAVTTVPLPPERHRAKFVNGYLIRFNAS